MLPSSIKHGKPAWDEPHQLFFETYNIVGEWTVAYYGNDVTKSAGSIFNHNEHGTEADARAKMLIYLLENKLITV
jgi:hypothetical protein